jgi:hypothetical protein
MWYSCGVIIGAWVPDDAILTPVELAAGVRLERIPAWVKDPRAVEHEGTPTRQAVEEAEVAIVVEYEGTPGVLDKWQQDAEEKIFMTGIALWLAKPTSWSAGHLLHFQKKGDPQSWRRGGPANRLLITPQDASECPNAKDLELATKLLAFLSNLRRDGTIWGAVRLLAMALSAKPWEPRFVLVWIVLEALFGPEDGREITYRISHRIAFFLGSSPDDRRILAGIAKEGYAIRSKVVHGGRVGGLTGEESVDLMARCETLVRASLKKLSQFPEIAEKFDSKSREVYLDGIVFEK